ncbi:MAG: ABC transporter permease [Devosia sp.]|uniref:ABC transporter permease n=1 Tax=Devosia sp. TaxID=1871048 RepID=UPI001A3F89B8|nr:ABC transporter permease [Devosia sp.]MBL8598953.1 ABC transporter permease [Devosia sp.]
MRGSQFLIAPALLVYGGLFVAAVAYFFAMSFWSVRAMKLVPDFTLQNYEKVLSVNTGPFLTTLLLALAIACFATLFGFVYAWIIRFRAGWLAQPLLLIALVTMFGGYLMKIYAWKTMLGSDGAINSALVALGIIGSPIEALLYSPVAVVISLSHFLLPFTILPAYAALRGITDAEIESARDLGAGSIRILHDITIPRSRSGIAAAFAIAYLISVGDYLTAQLVGGRVAMYGQLIAPQFGTYFNWPLGAAMSFSVLGVSLAVVTLFTFFLSRVGRP